MNHTDGADQDYYTLKKDKTSLPPRSEVHKEKKKKTKFKIKYPVIRLLALLFVLLPVVILSYLFNPDKKSVEPSTKNSSSTFESLSYEKNDKKATHTKIEEDEPATVESSIEQSSNEKITNEQDINQADSPTTEEAPQTQTSTTTETKEDVVLEKQEQPQEEPKEKYDIKYHKVKANETLYSVSIKYYKSRSGEELLKRWNDIKDNTIYEGQVLRIPIKIN
ncbi:LysM peptidoglycan-binding domain-containing protein [Fredinandcohnia sp. 179-A 10B2 NHS]|uniref:LysM peptidoglycan-binding domain-containing protein n=1 Tax=Fredinandcohnia sp. 179-A 10B2 NHS TaxID=3235176 RepID=UPI0039A1BE4C